MVDVEYREQSNEWRVRESKLQNPMVDNIILYKLHSEYLDRFTPSSPPREIQFTDFFYSPKDWRILLYALISLRVGTRRRAKAMVFLWLTALEVVKNIQYETKKKNIIIIRIVVVLGTRYRLSVYSVPAVAVKK